MTCWRVSAVCFAMPEPFCTALIVEEISSRVLFADSADLEARLRTSSATTAKPFPASPARAASIAAFSASMFVWNAMSSMDFMTSDIASDCFSI